MSQLKPFGKAIAVAIDVASPGAGEALRRAVAENGGRLDALVNNAAILIDEPRGILDADLGEIQRTLETNVYGPLRLAQAAIPLVTAGWGLPPSHDLLNRLA